MSKKSGPMSLILKSFLDRSHCPPSREFSGRKSRILNEPSRKLFVFWGFGCNQITRYSFWSLLYTTLASRGIQFS